MKALSFVVVLFAAGATRAQFSHWTWEVVDRLPQDRYWQEGDTSYAEHFGFGSPIVTTTGDIAAGALHRLDYLSGFMGWRTAFSIWNVSRYSAGTRSMVSRTSGDDIAILKLTPDGRVLVTTSTLVDDFRMSNSEWWRIGTVIQHIPGSPIKGTTSQLTAGFVGHQPYDLIPKIWDAHGREMPLPQDAIRVRDINGIGDAIVDIWNTSPRATGVWRQGVFTPVSDYAVRINNLGDILCVGGGPNITILSPSGNRSFTIPGYGIIGHELNDNGAVSLLTYDEIGKHHWLFHSGSQLYDVTSLVTNTSSLSNFSITDVNEFGIGVGMGTQNGQSVLLRFTPRYYGVPEPGSLVAVAVGISVFVRRKQLKGSVAQGATSHWSCDVE